MKNKIGISMFFQGVEMDSKLFIAGAFFVFMLISGFWLSHSGKPLNVFILTVHKLISLGALVFLAITIYRIQQVTPLSPLEIAAGAITLIFFIVMIATGGLLSASQTLPGVVLTVHQIMPYLLILTTSATLYLLLVRKA
jgi:hypothetical protein